MAASRKVSTSSKKQEDKAPKKEDQRTTKNIFDSNHGPFFVERAITNRNAREHGRSAGLTIPTPTMTRGIVMDVVFRLRSFVAHVYIAVATGGTMTQEQTCVYFSVTTGHQQTHFFSEPMFGLVFNAYYALNFVSTDQKQTMTQSTSMTKSTTTTFKFYYR